MYHMAEVKKVDGGAGTGANGIKSNYNDESS